MMRTFSSPFLPRYARLIRLSPAASDDLSAGGKQASWVQCEQRGEFARRDDPRGFVTAEGQEAALDARHKVIGLAAFGQGQQKIVGGIGRAFHTRQGIDILGELLNLLDQAASLI